jgi:hypothetical protein
LTQPFLTVEIAEEANRMMSELTAANAAIQSSLDTDLELGDFLD